MIVQIQQEPPSALADYACVSSAFEVSERFAVVTPNAGLGGLHLHAERVVAPYVKDYDAEPGQHPTMWPARFDLARWGILTAWADGKRMGGAVVARDTPGVEMLEGRSDLAVLWDLVNDGTAVYTPVQLKELVPADLNPNADLQSLIEGLAGRPPSDTVLAIRLNRRERVTFPEVTKAMVPFAKMWYFWSSTEDASRWALYGDVLTIPVLYEFTYPT